MIQTISHPHLNIPAYRGGRAGCWIKVKNAAVPAVTREAEEPFRRWGL